MFVSYKVEKYRIYLTRRCVNKLFATISFSWMTFKSLEKHVSHENATKCADSSQAVWFTIASIRHNQSQPILLVHVKKSTWNTNECNYFTKWKPEWYRQIIVTASICVGVCDGTIHDCNAICLPSKMNKFKQYVIVIAWRCEALQSVASDAIK